MGMRSTPRGPVQRQPNVPLLQDDAPTLVRAFLASATAAFAPLVAEHGDRWSLSVEQSSGQGLVTVAPEGITHVFIATAEFANAFVAGEITFGDREYRIQTSLGPTGTVLRYVLWEWADALESPEVTFRNTDFVLTVSRLEAIVTSMARGVAALQSTIASAPASAVARMQQARTRVQTAFQERLRSDEHRRASAAAADAFRKHDYRQVIALLQPYVDMLTSAERKKLEYARKKL